MVQVYQDSDPAIIRGIKTVGIGKKGSKDLPAELIPEICQEIKDGKVAAVQLGAFFGALYVKGLTPAEKAFKQIFEHNTFESPESLSVALCGDASVEIQSLCAHLLRGQTLDQTAAEQLGRFLLSDQPGDGARGLASSILRIRYETEEEYAGLLRALQQTIAKGFQKPPLPGDPIIQLAEPFDGVDHSYIITPLIAKNLQNKNYRCLLLCGRNSGPKLGNNLFDIGKTLNANFITENSALSDQPPAYGWFVDQKDLSPAMDRWVDYRKKIVKRPFMATLERFVNPAMADILIASAFHPPYGEKMLTVAERAGFPAAVIIRNGLEGTTAFPLKRAAKILCSTRLSDGHYTRHEFEFNPVEFLGFEVPIEEKMEQPSLEENARLIREYAENGQTDNDLFNYRVQITTAGIEQALQWIQQTTTKGEES